VDAWPNNVYAITLFVDDLATSKDFYSSTFGLDTSYEDEDSIVFDFNDTLINLLKVEAAERELVPGNGVARAENGNRFEMTVLVDDVDAKVGEITDRGVSLLVEPVDRPWGLRTASFQDPDARKGRPLRARDPPGRSGADQAGSPWSSVRSVWVRNLTKKPASVPSGRSTSTPPSCQMPSSTWY
jgi:catechol 2,3-dioxygenase-like lactoylglutathione lyase family enzyme